MCRRIINFAPPGQRRSRRLLAFESTFSSSVLPAIEERADASSWSRCVIRILRMISGFRTRAKIDMRDRLRSHWGDGPPSSDSADFRPTFVYVSIAEAKSPGLGREVSPGRGRLIAGGLALGACALMPITSGAPPTSRQASEMYILCFSIC